MDFTDGLLPQLQSSPGCVCPVGAGARGRTALADPLPPQDAAWGRAGTQNVALVSAGGMENKKDEVTAKRPCRM